MSIFGSFRARIDAIKGNANGSTGGVKAARAIDVYNRSKSLGEEVQPTPPVTNSGTYDMYAFIRAMTAGQSDIQASITALPLPLLYASLFSYNVQQPSSLYANIFPKLAETEKDLYASLRCLVSGSTEPVVYQSILLGTRAGLSIVRRLLTTLPDITAYIYGWDYSELSATVYVRERSYGDLNAIVATIAANLDNLYASITATYTKDLDTYLYSIPPEDLYGALTSIPPKDLLSYLVAVPPSDLIVFCGGHLPSDLYGNLVTVQPVDISAFIRSGYSGISDLGATLTPYGGYSSISSRIDTLYSSTYNLRASITCSIHYDLRARLLGWEIKDLATTIVGVRSSDLSCYISGISSSNTRDMEAFIRVAYGGTSNLNTSIYGWISAHTSDKIYNYDILSRPPRKFLLAHFGVGLTILEIEPIRGNFPDLHASITGYPFSVYDLKAYISPMLYSYGDLNATISAVTPYIHITKIPINFVNISDLSVYISAFSGYKNMSANITGWVSTSTGTPSGSGWVYISSRVKFYLGTDKGLYVLQPTRTIVSSVFKNTSQNPDLWAYMYGWDYLNLGASLTVQPTSTLSAYVGVNDLTHIKQLSATITSTYTFDLLSSITGIGGYSGISASIVSEGQISELSASIRPYLKVLGQRFIQVNTKPYKSLYAVINPISVCGRSSGYSSLGVFIRGTQTITSGVSLYATINVLSDVKDISASITGRKITVIKTIDFWFRSLYRKSSAITAVCIGVGNGQNSLAADIVPIPHTYDLYASISPFRHAFDKITKVENIKVYKDYYTRAELYKTIEMYLSSQVNKYVYDAISNALYEIEGEKWVLDLSELTDTGEFYDRYTGDRSVSVDSLLEFDSIDEAIRSAITILTEMHNSDLSATITAVGGYSNLYASILTTSSDRVKSLPSSIFIVNNEPVLYADISAYSGYLRLGAFIVGYGQGPEQLGADIRGVVYGSIGASIVATT